MKAKRIVSLLLVLLMLLSLVACGGNNKPAPNPQKDGEVSQEGEKQPEEAKSKYGGTLRVAQSAFEMSAFLGLPSLGNGTEPTLAQRAACEPLWYMNVADEIVWVLGTGYEVSDDGLTYTFGIRDGITFHDGSKLNAEVVAWNWSNAAFTAGTLSGWEKIEAVDDLHVAVTLGAPNPFFITLYAADDGLLISSKQAYDTYGEEYCMTHPVGTGPFVFASMEVGSYAKFTRNENYWQKDADGNQLPYLDAVEFSCISDPTVAAAALANDEIDIFYSELDGLQENLETYDLKDLVIDKGLVPNSARGVRFMVNNRKATLFGDVRLRQAVAYALDAEAIVAAFEDDTMVYDGCLPIKGSRDYPDDITIYGYDPEKAKSLLAEAGYPDGFEIEINIDTTPFADKMATLVQYYLGEVGIKVKIMAYENTERNAIQDQEDVWSQLTIGSSSMPGGYTNNAWNSRSPSRIKWRNMMPFDNDPKLVEYHGKVSAAATEAEAWEALKDYNRYAAEICSEYLFMHTYTNIHYYKNTLYPATNLSRGPYLVLEQAYFM